MMSSEEDTDCFGLYGDKLSKKAKRTRQRVDAGEPRNSYSSIPNFSSRPSFMSGGIYGAIFSQNQQHFGLFGPGYGPAKMLNELLGRQGHPGDEGACDAQDQVGGGRHSSEDGGSPSPHATELAHHMLRDILQGRKKELMALESELRAGPDNNNCIKNNNNNNHHNGDGQCVSADSEISEVVGVSGRAEGGSLTTDNSVVVDEDIAAPSEETPMDSEHSLPASPLPTLKNEPETVDTNNTDSRVKDLQPGSPDKSDQPAPLDMKRARVENIVSSMRSSPAPQQVNGCKKRKLYHPQQHDNYSQLGINMQQLLIEDEEDDDDDDDTIETPHTLLQKRVEKNALKSQLRSMQEQLAEMQQKYVQLCSRMEHESDTQEVEEVTSDLEQDVVSQTCTEKRTPISSPSVKTTQSPPPVQQTAPAPANIMSQVMSKMMSAAKIHPHAHQMRHQNPHGMPAAFNGPQHPLLQQQMHAEAHGLAMGHPHVQHPHHAISNAAAVYLGVSQKLFMEQEARMAKEAAMAAHAAADQQHHQQQQQQHQQQQQQQQHQTPHMNHSQHIPNHSGPVAHQSNSQSSQTLNQSQQSPQSMGKDSTNERPRPAAVSLSMNQVTGSDLEGLADALKTEITASLSSLVDSVVTRFVHQRRYLGKHSEAAAAAAEQLNKDLLLASQLLDRKSPRARPPPVTDRGSQATQPQQPNQPAGPFQHPKPPQQSQQQQQMQMAMYAHNGVSPHGASQNNMFCKPEPMETNPEQNEALSLVVTTKKKRHKVTDTRITPRTVSRILAQDSPEHGLSNGAASDCPSPRPYQQNPPPPPPPPPMIPVSLPTSVAIPNPSLHESKVFSPYSPFFGAHGPHMYHMGGVGPHSPPGMGEPRDSPPLPHPPAMLHPALLAAAHHGSSPDYGHLRAAMEANDRNSDCNSADISYDGVRPTSSTLTPMHLRKAKLMFFWVRYPSSAVLKMYFPDIQFNKNNTAQLVKWFSNFREFYYIQMEKYARQAVSEGVKNADELQVGGDSEIYRVLNLHYNRNNHIEVPSNFRYVVEQTLREFFKAIQGGKDTEQSWKKSIYKIISRLDDPVPEYFKSPNFLEQLE
ncbi:homeobox protein prospero-like [Ctenocephalides felis]|uniref:homeobox protein prospero-like n=1 Tax=Ctenocephalides felis TaxID=7515 RepID=UPI000E6E1131|nr:homeobox protein prospero-like [Ctenocephalides felis]